MKKKILVTGGAGFIGSHLCEELSKNSANEIFSLDNYFTGSVNNHIKNVNYIKGSTNDIAKLIQFEPDLIYHLGEYSRVERSFHDIEQVFDFNTQVNTSLIVGNNGVCFDTLVTNFTWQKIGDFINVFAPNIITPNTDGVNDCFEVEVPTEFEGCVEYEVYNRWGLKVFDTKDFQTGFCGFNAYNNQELSEGTYFYTLRIKDYEINGFIKIAR